MPHGHKIIVFPVRVFRQPALNSRFRSRGETSNGLVHVNIDI
jgi:hypothetical protein